MDLNTQNYLKNNKKMYNYLKSNSNYIKDLNRDSINLKKFENDMIEKYKIITSDKLNDVIDNIDLVSSMLNVFKN